MKRTESDREFSRIRGYIDGVLGLPLGKPMGREQLNAVVVHCGNIPCTGLRWRSKTAAERTALHDLADRGLLEVSGQTQGQCVRLTTAGVLANTEASGADPAAVVAFVEKVKTSPTVEFCGFNLVMGYHLMQTAGYWWSTAWTNSDTWKAYQHERVRLPVNDAVLCGWLHPWSDLRQQIFALSLTKAGMTAAVPTNLPKIRSYYKNWEIGFEAAYTDYSTNPPDIGNVVARMIPASRWYDEKSEGGAK